MTGASSRFETAMRELIRREGPAAEHPDPETWLAYHEGRLPPEREAQLQEHLLGCPLCVGLMQDLAAFEEAEEGALPASDLEVAAVLRSVRGVKARRRLFPFAMAASLLLAAASLFWALSLRREADTLGRQLLALSQPQVGVAIADLYAGAVARQAAPAPALVEVPEGTTFLTLVLNLPPGAGAATYRLEMLGPGGTEVWAGRGLPRNDRFNTLRLGLPRRFLPEGALTLRLYPDGGSAEKVAEYVLEIREAGDEAAP